MKVTNVEQLFSREISTLGSGEPTRHSGTAVPNLHWHQLLSSHSNPHRCLQIWTTNTWHRKSSETRESILKMWQGADFTKWRFKWMHLEKWRGGMAIP